MIKSKQYKKYCEVHKDRNFNKFAKKLQNLFLHAWQQANNSLNKVFLPQKIVTYVGGTINQAVELS